MRRNSQLNEQHHRKYNSNTPPNCLMQKKRFIIMSREHMLTLLHHHTWQPHTTLSPIITAVEFLHSILTDFSYQCVKGIFNTLQKKENDKDHLIDTVQVISSLSFVLFYVDLIFQLLTDKIG